MAVSPRAIGPVEASAPRSVQFAALRSTSGREQLARRRRRRPGRAALQRTPRARRGSSRRSRRRRDRRSARPRRPRRAASEAGRRAPARPPERLAVEPEIAHGAPTSSVRASGNGLQRVKREDVGARVVRGGERFERGGAAHVADEPKRRSGVGSPGDRGLDLPVGDAEQGHFRLATCVERVIAAGETDGEPGGGRRRGDRAPTLVRHRRWQASRTAAHPRRARRRWVDPVPVPSSEIPDG